jgi:bifunctional non-homologous end joining protein LigD
VSRNGHQFASFVELAEQIGAGLRYSKQAVIDGEIVCLDSRGHPQFNNLLFRRGQPVFYAFDVLWSDGQDWRYNVLAERKADSKDARRVRRALVNTRDFGAN